MSMPALAPSTRNRRFSKRSSNAEDLRAHLRTLPNGSRRAATQWRKLESYRALLPAESPEYLKELFCSNVRAMLEILEKEPSTEQAAG